MFGQNLFWVRLTPSGRREHGNRGTGNSADLGTPGGGNLGIPREKVIGTLPEGTSGAKEDTDVVKEPLLQRLQWTLARAPSHGVEDVAGGSRECHKHHPVAAHNKGQLGEKS